MALDSIANALAHKRKMCYSAFTWGLYYTTLWIRNGKEATVNRVLDGR